ncbi:MAG: hypothetical protein IKT38_03795 [Clostridia bacterium]|nr:hypothetical protein [Clostridia bacterium]
MNYEDLISFKENTADPAQRKIFDSTELKEGMGFVDSLELNRLDGRNCGYDMRIVARGLEFKDGNVETFEIEKLDVPLEEFIKDIKYPFMFHGVLMLSDEIWNIEVNAEIGCFKKCSVLFEELSYMDNVTCLADSREYQKMLYIHGEAPEEEPVANLSL